MTAAKVAVPMRNYCQKRYGMVDGEATAALTVGIFGDELVVAIPAGDESKARQIFEVVNRKGDMCRVRMKKVPMRQRHGLSKDDFATNGSYHNADIME